MFSKLYGFYHDNGTESLIKARFQELLDNGISIETVTIASTDPLAIRWGISMYPTFVLSKYDSKGPILEGAFPAYMMIDWLNKYKITGNNE